MKILFLGLTPLVLFWWFEEKFGTTAGIIAALVWSAGELLWEWLRRRRIEKTTLLSGALVALFGGMDLLFEGHGIFLYQPVLGELVMVGFLIWGAQGDPPRVVKLLPAQKIQLSQDPAILNRQHRLLRRTSRTMAAFTFMHAILLAGVAYFGTTGQWLAFKGVGLFVFFGVAMGWEWLRVRRRSV